jgi:hypothetical protein
MLPTYLSGHTSSTLHIHSYSTVLSIYIFSGHTSSTLHIHSYSTFLFIPASPGTPPLPCTSTATTPCCPYTASPGTPPPLCTSTATVPCCPYNTSPGTPPPPCTSTAISLCLSKYFFGDIFSTLHIHSNSTVLSNTSSGTPPPPGTSQLQHCVVHITLWAQLLYPPRLHTATVLCCPCMYCVPVHLLQDKTRKVKG